MKTVLVSTLVLLASSAIAPAAHAQSDSQTDQQLAHAVRVAEAHAGVGMSHVFVFAHSGRITLTGWVPERDHVARAEKSAMSVPGVTSVDNWLSPDAGSLNAH